MPEPQPERDQAAEVLAGALRTLNVAAQLPGGAVVSPAQAEALLDVLVFTLGGVDSGRAQYEYTCTAPGINWPASQHRTTAVAQAEATKDGRVQRRRVGEWEDDPDA